MTLLTAVLRYCGTAVLRYCGTAVLRYCALLRAPTAWPTPRARPASAARTGDSGSAAPARSARSRAAASETKRC
ncbi:hypothetical protein C0Q92_16570 [Streptomyces albidoflavus]|uniref:Uncharacterized protein n=1 Tax=Streptomyces albidoflavus TaxID=1886 RepID=A0A8G1ZS45_9ACTN|nr:hypothetical protein C0Q92_16570 [Streptomyces albidoflavus]